MDVHNNGVTSCLPFCCKPEAYFQKHFYLEKHPKSCCVFITAVWKDIFLYFFPAFFFTILPFFSDIFFFIISFHEAQWQD